MQKQDILAVTLVAAMIAGMAAAWLVPGLVKRWWVGRQNKLSERMRQLYVLGEQALMRDDLPTAEAVADEIEILERTWSGRDGWLARILIGLLAFAAGWTAFMVLRFGSLVAASASSDGTWSHMLTDIWMFAFLGLLGSLHGVMGIYYFSDWHSQNEPRNLAGRLRQMLLAGRGLSHARAADRRAKGAIAPRALFGLGTTFTRKELDRARRRLARAHHPDRWSSAPEPTRRAHEAAMKRINAAYEELAAEVS